MKRSYRLWLIFLAVAASCASAAPSVSSYAGEHMRDIKALSPEDVEAYRSGKGMVLAKAAELNGYPGPAHVLELAAPLRLTPAQRARTEALFGAMAAKASALGRALVDEERKLDRLFAARTATPELLNRSLDVIGALQAKVRAAHLEAHLGQLEILTPEQVARYAALRGYGGQSDAADHGHHQH